MSLPDLSRLSVVNTSVFMPNAEALDQDVTFDEEYVMTNTTRNSLLDAFKRDVFDLCFGDVELALRHAKVGEFISLESPPDQVDWTWEQHEEFKGTKSFLYVYKYRVDVIPADASADAPFINTLHLSQQEFLEARMTPSYESAQVKYLRSIWSQHYPATKNDKHVVEYEPVISSGLITPATCSVPLPESYTVREFIHFMFTLENWRNNSSINNDLKHFALEKAFLIGFDYRDVGDATSEDLRDFENVLSYTEADGTFIDKSIQTEGVFLRKTIVLAMVVYRIMVLIDDAITNMFLNPSNGPETIRTTQEMLEEAGDTKDKYEHDQEQMLRDLQVCKEERKALQQREEELQQKESLSSPRRKNAKN